MGKPKHPPHRKPRDAGGAAIDVDIDIDEQSAESFPASDPPSFNAPGRIGSPARDKDKTPAKSRN